MRHLSGGPSWLIDDCAETAVPHPLTEVTLLDVGACGLLNLHLPGSRGKPPFAEQPLGTHDVQDDNLLPIKAIEQPTGGFDYLAIAGPPELRRATSAFGMIRQLSGVIENPSDQPGRSNRVFQRNVFGNGLEIA